jgi:hypothetical protein
MALKPDGTGQLNWNLNKINLLQLERQKFVLLITTEELSHRTTVTMPAPIIGHRLF